MPVRGLGVLRKNPGFRTEPKKIQNSTKTRQISHHYTGVIGLLLQNLQ
jgi:hypothetical protein